MKLYENEDELQHNLSGLLQDETRSNVATEYESKAGFIGLVPNQV
jgi:hypothetical protein